MDVKSKNLIEWSSWTLLSIMLFIGAVGATFLAPFVMLAAPVPLMIIVCRRGPAYGMVSALFGALFVLIFMGFEAMFLYLCGFALLGLMMGIMLVRAKSGADYAASAIAGSLALKLVMMFVYTRVWGINPFVLSPDAANVLSSSLTSALSNKVVGVSPDDIGSYVENLSQTLSVMMPSMLILFSAADSAAGYALTWLYMKRVGEVKLPKLPPFGLWRFPKNIFWALLAGLVLDMASKAFPDHEICSMLAINLMEVLRAVFLIEGLSLLWYFTGLYNGNRVLRSVLVVFCAFFAPMSYVLSMVGIFDIWYDLRKRIKLRRKQR